MATVLRFTSRIDACAAYKCRSTKCSIAFVINIFVQKGVRHNDLNTAVTARQARIFHLLKFSLSAWWLARFTTTGDWSSANLLSDALLTRQRAARAEFKGSRGAEIDQGSSGA